ncbi:protein lifeguard 3-like [Dromiciops gliroides]|uniref:protein lifeguard 3-like n=1 Tax=Dromiciops gliroides TaxID=33562 RepID=UPI001CC42691|nr:protein lifeguard 3-like [Dromiciops gliroides]
MLARQPHRKNGNILFEKKTLEGDKSSSRWQQQLSQEAAASESVLDASCDPHCTSHGDIGVWLAGGMLQPGREALRRLEPKDYTDHPHTNSGYYCNAMGFITIVSLYIGPRRRFPWNIILLTIFTLAMSFMTGCIVSMYNTKAVILAMIITAIVTIAVTIFCFQTKVDFTSCAGLFCVLGIVLTVTGIITAIVMAFKYVYWLHMLYAALGAIAFTLFLAYDTQLVLGNRKHTISPEEYITGALQIYTDIIYI